MATHFCRHAADGTYEYHDSRESMIAVEGRENSQGEFRTVNTVEISKIPYHCPVGRKKPAPTHDYP